jgi:hypothetical protein
MRKLPVAATVLAIGLAMVGFSIVGLEGGATAGTELRLFIHDTQQAQLDLGDKGDSVGDRYIFSGDVFDHEGGTKVGRVGGFCDAVSKRANGEGEDVCIVHYGLARGQLMAAFIGDNAALFGGTPLPFSITGGTGIYRDAQGDGTVTVLNATDADIVIRLN